MCRCVGVAVACKVLRKSHKQFQSEKKDNTMNSPTGLVNENQTVVCDSETSEKKNALFVNFFIASQRLHVIDDLQEVFMTSSGNSSGLSCIVAANG